MRDGSGWIVTAFGVRGAMQRRRTGDTGFRGISGKPGSPPWWAGALFLLALIGGAAAPVAALAGLPDLPGGDAAAVRWTGLAVTLAGIAVSRAPANPETGDLNLEHALETARLCPAWEPGPCRRAAVRRHSALGRREDLVPAAVGYQAGECSQPEPVCGFVADRAGGLTP